MAMAILASATMANAASVVFYTATSGNAQSGITTQGSATPSPGLPLNLTCDTSGAPGSCSWVITMQAAIGPGGVLGWSSDLVTGAGNGVSASAPAIVAGPFNNATAPGTPGSGASLLLGSHGQTFSAVQPQTLSLLTFTLSRSFATGNLSVATINAGTAADASVVWTNETTGDYESVGFAPNLPGSGQEGTMGLLPSIIITNTPEPASLGLLAIGAMALIRRRSAR
jgi:hypothetical protein